jgi:predicted MFS family arabinose efflux permease
MNEPRHAVGGRTIAALSAAAFMSASTIRVGDPLIPQIANDFGVGVGAAAIVTTSFALAYGIFQLVHGALGDRYGKQRLIVLATALSAFGTASVALATDIATLGVLRFLSGVTASAIIPLAMAHIGDAVPYEQRQATLARFLFGQILGSVFGQVAGGVLGEFLHWRAIFLVLGALYVVAALVILAEWRSGRVPDRRSEVDLSPPALLRRYAGLVVRRRARVVLCVVFIEGMAFYGGFSFFAAYLHDEFGLDYARSGLVIAFFGVGGIAYALMARRLLTLMGERGFAATGGAMLMAAFALATLAGPGAGFAAVAALSGLGFYTLHTTLQTNATQMAPEARGSAVAIFASCLFLGTSAGVALGGLVIETVGYAPLFLGCGATLLVLGTAFSVLLGRLR